MGRVFPKYPAGFNHMGESQQDYLASRRSLSSPGGFSRGLRCLAFSPRWGIYEDIWGEKHGLYAIR